MKKRFKNSSGFIQIVMILVVLALIGGAYYFGTLKSKTNVVSEVPTQTSNPIVSTEPVANPTAKPTVDPTAGWKTYANEKMKISLKYPSTSGFQIFYFPDNNDLVFAINTAQYDPIFFDVAYLPNTNLGKWYQMAYSATKQDQPQAPKLQDGPKIDGLESYKADFNFEGPGRTTFIFVQKGNGLYQINIPTTDNKEQYQILSTFKFTQ